MEETQNIEIQEQTGIKKDLTCKIFVSYHKPFYLLKNEIFKPIHVGRAVATEISKDGLVDNEKLQWLFDNMIGDNTGENISYKNREYCELTGLYWVWRNYLKLGNPDYVGFMQYRRHFIFNEDLYTKNIQDFDTEEKTYSIIHLNFIPDCYINKIGLTEEKIMDYCNKYDCIIPQEGHFEYINIDTLKRDYIERIEGTHLEDYELMIKTLSEQFPKYSQTVSQQAETPNKYMYQMFICRKEIFFDYCNVLFTTLEKLEKLIDTSTYSVNGKRTLGYLGELIFGTYFHYLYKEQKYRVKKLKVTYIESDKNQRNYKSSIIDKLKRKNLKYKIFKKIYPSSKMRKHYREKEALAKHIFKRYKILTGENNG